jgi:ferritin|tara:strand:+ start:220 stop:723 length:504 start_codon:yes stop_codon:yes gene_type:complete
MNEVVRNAFNEQIKSELFSGYLYLSMSAHFDHENLPGFARWMRLQAQEELAHTMRLFDYVLRRGGRVELHGINAPPTDFGPPLTLFESVLEHERAVTGMIHALFELSGKEGDWAAQQELQWFIAEQVEEEDTASTARDQVSMAGDDQAALLMLDQQFGSRTAGPEQA